MATKAPKGYKTFGDVEEVAINNLNAKINSNSGYQPKHIREIISQTTKNGTITVITPAIDSDKRTTNKSSVYLDCVFGFGLSGYKVVGIKYVTNFKQDMHYLFEFQE